MNNSTIDGVSRNALEQALLAMKRIYQAGYDRILEAGGQSDTPEYMMAGDPTARELRALLDAPATGICRDCFTEQPIGRSCVTCEKIEGERGKLVDEWLDMASAPRDGTMLRLLVQFEEHSTEDAAQAPTIGANNFDNDGEDRWQFAGWCWSHDHFVEGKGVPVGWLPMLQVQQAPLTFQFRHRATNELRSVRVTRAEIAEDMADTLFEKLVSQFCECEPLGETNEVECRCDEYGDEFELAADAGSDSTGESALPQAQSGVAIPSPEEITLMVTKAARQADLTPGANYYTAAELGATAIVDKIKELNPLTPPPGATYE